MPKIKKLSQLEIQKIAAGEVVERPANVLKELIENSLDASSSQITIYLEASGKEKIRIIDNGSGMSLEDARLCIEDHATSKISSVEELNRINSFGFRGEALSSISAVSHITIITKEQNAKEIDPSLKLEIIGGEIVKESQVSGNIGTDISITNLFYNVPARKKFLKTKETEWNLITHLFTAFSLDYLNVSFQLFHDNKLIYNCPRVDSLEARSAQIFDYSISSKLISFKSSQERMNLVISGIISNPTYNRYDRSEIYIFVNRRWIKNYKLVNSIIKGYQNMLPTNKYPLGALFIQIDPNFIDINIHPRKEDIQFLHPIVIESAIEKIIKFRLEEYQAEKLGIQPINSQSYNIKNKNNINLFKDFNKIKEYQYQQSCSQDPRLINKLSSNSIQDNNNINNIKNVQSCSAETSIVESKNQDVSLFTEFPEYSGLELSSKYLSQNIKLPEFSPKGSDNKNLISLLDLSEPDKQDLTGYTQPSEHNKQDLILYQELTESYQSGQININLNLYTESMEYRLIGQVLNTYIIIELPSGLTFIDQHGAHERIIYERIKTNFENTALIPLIFGEIINLTKQDIALIEPFFPIIKNLGIGLEQIDTNRLMVKEVAIFLKDKNLSEIIKETVSFVKDTKEGKEDTRSDLNNMKKIVQEKIHAKISCSSAVRAGDQLTIEAMDKIIKDLYKTENRLTCPHGRPTIWPIEITEIEKKFKRNYK